MAARRRHATNPRGAEPEARPAAAGLRARIAAAFERGSALVALGLCLFGAFMAVKVAIAAWRVAQSDLPTFQAVVWWLILAATAGITVVLLRESWRQGRRWWRLRAARDPGREQP